MSLKYFGDDFPPWVFTCLLNPSSPGSWILEFQNPFWQTVTSNGMGKWSPVVWRHSVRSKGVCATKEHHWFRTDLWPKDHPWRQKGHVPEVTVEHSVGTFSAPCGGNWDAGPSALLCRSEQSRPPDALALLSTVLPCELLPLPGIYFLSSTLTHLFSA